MLPVMGAFLLAETGVLLGPDAAPVAGSDVITVHRRRLKHGRLPAPTLVVDVPDHSEQQAGDEDGDVDGETALVERLVVLAEDLCAVDASDVAAHDRPV